MLQTVPTNRYSIKQLLKFDIFTSLINIPTLNILFKSEEKFITMNMLNNEKENLKEDMGEKNSLKEINDDENKSKDKNTKIYDKSKENSNKNILNHIKIDERTNFLLYLAWMFIIFINAFTYNII